MFALLCKLWPFLLGGLIGWLFMLPFLGRFKKALPAPKAKTIEKIVEKKVEVDNPKLLSRISALEGDVNKYS